MRNKLLKKFLSFSYGSVIGAGLAFITTMVATRILQPEEFGKVSMFTLFISISMVISGFGTDQAFVRFFYEEEKEKRGALLYNCLKVSLLVLVPVLIIMMFIRKDLLNFLFSEYSVMIFIALISSIVIQVLTRFGTLVIRMQQKGNVFSLLEIFNKLSILIGVIVLYIYFGDTYKILIFSTVIASIILVFFLIFSQRSYWDIRNIKLKDTLHSKKDIFHYGYPLVFTTAVMWIFEGFDKFAIRQWTNYNELGLYAAAFKIIGLLAIMKMAFTTFWAPVAYESYQKDPKNTSFYANVSNIVSFFMMVVGVLVIMLKDIIILLLGSGYKDASLMLSFLVFIPIMCTISEVTVVGINFHKKVKWHIVIVSVACITNMIGNWMLVPQYGGIGASISTGVAYILFFTLRTFISLYYYKVNYGLVGIYLSTFVLITFASYTLIPYQPIIEQVVGLIAIGLIILIYSKEIRRFYSSRKIA